MDIDGERSQRTAPSGLLQGYDTFSGAGRNIALTGDTELFGGESSVSYRVCEGIQELMQELEVNQSFTIGLFGIFNVSQKMEFVKRQALTKHSICIAVHAKHTAGTETVTNVTLRPNTGELESSADLKEFLQVYGDSYVVSRTTGGEYYGVYTFHSVTEEQQEELRVGMEVGGILKAFVGEVGLEAKISSFRSSQNVRVSFDQEMTGVRGVGLPHPDNMIEFALQFPSLPLSSPVVTNIRLSGYERVPGIGSRFSTIARNVQKLTHGNFVARLARVHEIRNHVNLMMDIYAAYGGYVPDDRLLELHASVEADEVAIKSMVEAYESDPTEPVIVDLRSPDYGTPSLAFITRQVRDVDSLTPHDNISDFDDIGENVQNFLEQLTRFSAFQVRSFESGNARTSLIVTYHRSGRSGAWTVNHGPVSGGVLSRVLVVPDGQFVKTFTGSSRNIALHQITIDLTNGESLTHGTPGNRTHAFPTPDKFFLLGFRGQYRADGRVPRTSMYMRLVYASFIPCVWR